MKHLASAKNSGSYVALRNKSKDRPQLILSSLPTIDRLVMREESLLPQSNKLRVIAHVHALREQSKRHLASSRVILLWTGEAPRRAEFQLEGALLVVRGSTLLLQGFDDCVSSALLIVDWRGKTNTTRSSLCLALLLYSFPFHANPRAPFTHRKRL